jgi:16S rRNA (cytosine1402-N4)-methyltransferase
MVHAFHAPVLVRELLALLSLQPGETVLDVTVGLGGHARHFLEAIGPSGSLIGIDADAPNLALAQISLQPWRSQVKLLHGNFRDLRKFELPFSDVLFADLGLSSVHVDDPQRGFTFRAEAPLDLRYDRSCGETAAHYLARSSEGEIREILRIYGELWREAHRLAKAMHAEAKNMRKTVDLRRCIEGVFGYRAPRILPQIFQALRIAVNDELGALRVLLQEGPQYLKSGGRFAVISYHSLEDRLVKEAFRKLCMPPQDPLTGRITHPAPFEFLTRKPVRPAGEEIESNSRARSARLRVICKKV